MEFNCVPPLLHVASVKVALRLLQDIDIEKMLDLDIMRPYRLTNFDHGRYELWKLIESTAVEKLPPLPPSLPTKVAKFIRPMHYEFLSWLLDHDLMTQEKGFCIKYREFICWKSDGTIDRRQTAKKYVDDEDIDTRDRFIMACSYFFTNEILELWERIKIIGLMSLSSRGINSAVRLWVNVLLNGITKPIHEMFEDYFSTECLSESDIPLRLSPYFRFLSLECRRDYFVNHRFSVHADDFRLCLYEMQERERIELFQAIPAIVVMSYLDWPFHYLFIKMANQLLEHLLLHDVERIMDYILNFLFQNEYVYSNILKEFWSIIPDCFKVEIIKDEERFKPFEVVLNYDWRYSSHSLLEAVVQCRFE